MISRKEAHEKGIRHRTSHVWILREKEGRLQILLQKRSQNKDSFPGCYDISSAGHIPAGQDYVTSALRELQEELGYTATEKQLIFCGKRLFHFEREFHNRGFSDNQVSSVFALWLDQDEDAFTLQEEEVESVRWFDFEGCKKAVAEHTIPNCIFPEELEMLPRKKEGKRG
ncbi:MAG: NUDIX domain-containing protein [Lachnospiraceae bacterium]